MSERAGSKHRLPIVHVRVLLSCGEKCTARLVITDREEVLHGDKCRKAKSVLHVITEKLSLKHS